MKCKVLHYAASTMPKDLLTVDYYIGIPFVCKLVYTISDGVSTERVLPYDQ